MNIYAALIHQDVLMRKYSPFFHQDVLMNILFKIISHESFFGNYFFSLGHPDEFPFSSNITFIFYLTVCVTFDEGDRSLQIHELCTK